VLGELPVLEEPERRLRVPYVDGEERHEPSVLDALRRSRGGTRQFVESPEGRFETWYAERRRSA
jgi:hypothetical protein